MDSLHLLFTLVKFVNVLSFHTSMKDAPENSAAMNELRNFNTTSYMIWGSWDILMISQ